MACNQQRGGVSSKERNTVSDFTPTESSDLPFKPREELLPQTLTLTPNCFSEKDIKNFICPWQARGLERSANDIQIPFEFKKRHRHKCGSCLLLRLSPLRLTVSDTGWLINNGYLPLAVIEAGSLISGCQCGVRFSEAASPPLLTSLCTLAWYQEG